MRKKKGEDVLSALTLYNILNRDKKSEQHSLIEECCSDFSIWSDSKKYCKRKVVCTLNFLDT